jgi:dTDP-4-dehydrorhamnose reductase
VTVVVTGASGYLGRRVLLVLRDAVGVSLGDDAVATITEIEPDAVIHLAAVNPGAGDAASMTVVNVELARAVAAAALAVHARFVHVSTDVVHDGTSAPYADSCPPSPVGHYARTKAEGEAAVFEARPGAVIVRTSLLWDPDEPGRWVEEMSAAIAAAHPVTLWSDQYRQPTPVADLADVLVRLAREPSLSSVRGLLNVTGRECLTRAEFGRRLLEHFGVDGTELVQDVSAPPGVPRDLRLDNTRAHALGLCCRGVDELLDVVRWRSASATLRCR